MLGPSAGHMHSAWHGGGAIATWHTATWQRLVNAWLFAAWERSSSCDLGVGLLVILLLVGLLARCLEHEEGEEARGVLGAVLGAGITRVSTTGHRCG